MNRSFLRSAIASDSNPHARSNGLRRLVRSLVVLWLSMASVGAAGADLTALAGSVERVERDLNARLGVLVREIGTGAVWAYRADERFLMNSTVKVLICAAILDRVASGEIDLDQLMQVEQADLILHAPLTEQRVGDTVSVEEGCAAAIDLSDNTAANLLLERLGGPRKVTAFLRRIGDQTTRLDRMEPALNEWAEGDVRDTTTPTAMLATLEAVLLGDALDAEGRERLRAWMSTGAYTGAFVRAAAPDTWEIADKSGAGTVTRTYVALVTPPDREAWLIGVFLSEAEADFATRNAAVTSVTAAVVEALAVH